MADGIVMPAAAVGRGRSGSRLFEITVAGRRVPDYRLRVTYSTRRTSLEIDDPYRYGRVLTDFDLHLLGEGTHHRAFEKLGAHRINVGIDRGVHFAVWAPNAERVSVIGDFNGWDGRVHPMRLLVPSGIWELFVPDLPDGEKYKFEIRTPDGRAPEEDRSVRRSPSRRRRRPRRSSATFRATSGATATGWRRDARAAQWLDRPMSVYEVHLGSWARVPEEGSIGCSPIASWRTGSCRT